ncbi:uncharacterized protein LOC131638779 [Vicia villosa]|uniref:uncharacterized protein LOC131638779 n=1 Tax=Vicia villosa TaxID=3911 RepID=UPI00273C03B2|nr:uncharacterized protein LOC131638779 [Vicia villosa]
MSQSYNQSSSCTKEDHNFCSRPADTTAIRLRINHGGDLVHNPCKLYVNGKVKEMNWTFDVDFMCYMDFIKVVNNLGYIRIKGMWYHHPKFSFERGLRPLNNDADVLKFGEDMNGYDVGNIYVEHIVDEPVVLSEEQVREYVEPVQDTIEIESDDEVHLDNSEEDEDFVQDDKDDLGDSEFDELDEDDWDWTHEVPSHTFMQENNDANQASSNQEPTKASDFEEAHDVESDDFDTPQGSEDEGEEHKFPKFKMPDCGDQVRFELGMTFATKSLIRDAVKSFAMERIKNLHFKKNDQKRIVVKCEKDCPFHMRFSKRVANQCWQLVSLTDDHTCHRTARNRQAKTEWLAKKFIPLLRHTPEMRPKGLIAEALEKWGVKLSSA